MVRLSLNRLNEVAPYPVTYSEQYDDYRFVTDGGIVYYICETGDGRQEMRSRLFQYWYETASNKTQYIYITASILDSDGIVNHAALIVRSDNPDVEAITYEFTAAIRLLSDKP